MELVTTYTEYSNINSEYIKYIEELMKTDLSICSEEVKNKLLFFKERIDLLRLKADDLNGDSDDVKDLRYLIIDALLLSVDLVNFYSRSETERFKMRATNYIMKKQRAEMFKF